MKIISLITGNKKPFDVAQELGQHMIAKGEAEKYEQTPALKPIPGEQMNVGGVIIEHVPEHDLTFALKKFTDGAPYLYANCPRCNPQFRYAGPDPASHPFRHDRKEVQWPADLIADYLPRYKAFTIPKPVAQKQEPNFLPAI